MKNKFITIIIALVCVLCCTFALAACNDNEENDNVKDGKIHTYRENGVEYEFRYSGVNISGPYGSINDKGMVIKGIKPDASVTELSIPSKIGGEDVKIINDEGTAATGIKSVTVPDSVTVILSGFNGWTALESIELSNNLKYIDYDVCENTNIKSLTIPDSVLHLADCAFLGNTALESVRASADMLVSFLSLSSAAPCRSNIKTVNVTSGNKIYRDTFKGYSSLKSVSIAESVDTIDDRAFKDLASFTELNYMGTKAKWNQVTKGEDWNSGSSFVVNCSDGRA